MRIRRVTACGLLGVLAATSACQQEGGEKEGGERLVAGTRSAVAAEQAFTENIEASGVITGRPGTVVALSAPSPARIASVSVVAGQRVVAGAALVELDQVAFRGAMQAADAALTAAEQNAARQQRLAAAGIAPRRDVEQAATELAVARAAAETASRQSELSVLRSPIAGVVTSVNATPGATADPAVPLVQVADAAALDIVFNLAPSQAAVLHTGAHVELLSGGSTIGKATVMAVGGAVDSATRAVVVRASVSRTTRRVQIGETMTARISVATNAHAIVVPLEAVVPDGEGFKVFVLDADGTAHARPVVIGGRTEAHAEVKEGLKAGERVVTYGAYGMDDSVKVAPSTTAPRKPDAT